MNLTKVFNLNYLLQNLKKSRTVLAIFIGLIPILNTIILIMTLTSNNNHVLGFNNISYLNIPGIYFLPVIISICLFNYIYKKKSVDFINSMPISRKTIFITNTILGILILVLMLVINTILIMIISLIFNTPIPFMMLLDYLWFFSLVYIFVFSATNLAMTISGNAITQLVITLLLLFLIPYTSIFINELYNEEGTKVLLECQLEKCNPNKYYCYDNTECIINKKDNKYNFYIYEIKNNTYTTPFALFYGSLTSNEGIFNKVSIIKMVILSIIYIAIGFILFTKRKMEVCETTFKNIHIHNLVKSLTLIPIASIAYALVRNESTIFIIFIVVIMSIYYFIYDLITKRNIANIKLSALYFLVTIIIITGLCSIIDKDETNKMVLKYDDIKEVAIELDYELDYQKIYTNNQELINLVVNTHLNAVDMPTESLGVYLKTTNNKEYEFSIDVDLETYEKILTILGSEEEYTSQYKDIDFNKVYALKIGSKLLNKEDAKPYLELIKTTLNKLTFKDFIKQKNKYIHTNGTYNIYLYTYNNHDRREYTISGYIDYDLLNTIVNANNQQLKEKLTKEIPVDYYLYYENAYLEQAYNIDYYVIRSAKNELYDFIYKNIDDKVDMRKERFTFAIQINNFTYYFSTNKVEEINDILEKKYEEIKNTSDYKEYYGITDDEGATYYD